MATPRERPATRPAPAGDPGMPRVAALGHALTQQIGYAAHLTGRVHGIWYTSAREPQGSCLCVFPDRLSALTGDRVVARGTYPQRLP